MNGAAREQFIGWMADRFQERHATPLDRMAAEADAKSCLESFEEMESVEFGHPDYDWGPDGASDLADEEIHAGWENVSCG